MLTKASSSLKLPFGPLGMRTYMILGGRPGAWKPRTAMASQPPDSTRMCPSSAGRISPRWDPCSAPGSSAVHPGRAPPTCVRVSNPGQRSAVSGHRSSVIGGSVVLRRYPHHPQRVCGGEAVRHLVGKSRLTGSRYRRASSPWLKGFDTPSEPERWGPAWNAKTSSSSARIPAPERVSAGVL